MTSDEEVEWLYVSCVTIGRMHIELGRRIGQLPPPDPQAASSLVPHAVAVPVPHADASPVPPRRLRPLGWLPPLVVSGIWIAAIAASDQLHASWPVRRSALFIHLVSLIAGLGSVVVIDVYGALWIAGRRPLDHLVRLANDLHAVIWIGLAGLVGSGILLHPNLSSTRTRIKLALVLIAGLNGLWAKRLTRQLGNQPHDHWRSPFDRRLLAKLLASGVVSQLAWWGATAIGFIATTHRR